MRKKVHKLISISLALLILCGCKKNDSNSIKDDLNDISSYGQATNSDVDIVSDNENEIPSHVDYSYNEESDRLTINADVKSQGFGSCPMYDMEPEPIDEAYIKDIASKLFDGGKYTCFRYIDDMSDEELLLLKELADREYLKVKDSPWLWSRAIPFPDDISYLINNRDLNYVYNPQISSDQLMYTRYICTNRDQSQCYDYEVYFDHTEIEYERFNEITATDYCMLAGEVDGETWVLIYNQSYEYGSVEEAIANPYIEVSDFSDIQNNDFRKYSHICTGETFSGGIFIKPLIKNTALSGYYNMDETVEIIYGSDNPADMEKSRNSADEMLRRIGLDNLENIYTMYRAVNVDDTTKLNGYMFVYNQNLGNAQNIFAVTFSNPYTLWLNNGSSELGSAVQQGYTFVSVDDKGVEGVMITPQYICGEQLTSQSPLLSFDKINTIAIERLVNPNSTEITSIEFGYVIVSYGEKHATVPAWCYVLKPQSLYDTARIVGVCINAIDGELILSNQHNYNYYWDLEY